MSGRHKHSEDTKCPKCSWQSWETHAWMAWGVIILFCLMAILSGTVPEYNQPVCGSTIAATRGVPAHKATAAEDCVRAQPVK